MIKIYKKAILPLGFEAGGISCGIKRAEKLDLALFYSWVSAKAACKFTTNKIQAAPIKLNKKYLKHNQGFQAIIVNSGNANCFTGSRGYRDARDLTKSLAKILKLKQERILSSSTGIIGRRLPLAKIKKALPKLVSSLSKQGIDKAKRAIMTTDKFVKELTVKFNIDNQIVTICGIAKGAGMIAPSMATMLCFIFSDARVTQRAFKRALNLAVENSFNCITVDGCMSTNDSLIALANGKAGNASIDINPVRDRLPEVADSHLRCLISNGVNPVRDTEAMIGEDKISNGVNKNFDSFVKALNIVCLGLAKLIISDAEGATKFIQIKVDRANSFAEAKRVALSIANSNLFKTAMYGQDPNWGRIVAAVGASGIGVREKDLKIKISPLNKREINVIVSLKRGNAKATVYTSDLTPEYVKINAAYN